MEQEIANSKKVQQLEKQLAHMQEVHPNELKELKRLNGKEKHSLHLFELWTKDLKTLVQAQLVELAKNNNRL